MYLEMYFGGKNQAKLKVQLEVVYLEMVDLEANAMGAEIVYIAQLTIV